LPDLVQLTVSNPPENTTAAMSLTVTDSVRNQGAIATATTSTRYYLSLDAVKSTGDLLLTGTRSVAALAIGATNTGSKVVKAPSGLAAGTYYLLACADDTNTATESSEANNCVASTTVTTVR
jgi:subtilase family serine protease